MRSSKRQSPSRASRDTRSKRQNNGACLNGVDLDRLEKTINDMGQDANLAKCCFRATNRWVSGGHSQAEIQDFSGAGQLNNHQMSFTCEIDEPELLLGTDKGPNPVEYVLAALTGCLTSSLVYHAAARGIELGQVESRVEGDLDLRGFLGLDDRVRNGFDIMRVTFRIDAEVPQETLDELVELAAMRSPVFDIVTRPIPVLVAAEKLDGQLH